VCCSTLVGYVLWVGKAYAGRKSGSVAQGLENHAATVALFHAHNLGGVHQTLRVTRAMEAGVAAPTLAG
jgi:hypothetical protein